MKKKLFVGLLTALVLIISIISVNASTGQQYNTDVNWLNENGELKATATFDYKKFDNSDIDMFLLELYKDGNPETTIFYSTAWGSDDFPTEGIEQAIDMNETIEAFGDGTYTFRIGVCSDTFNDFSQHWDTEQLNVLAWSSFSPEFIYVSPEEQLETPIIITFANGTFDYYIAGSSYVGNIFFQLELKAGDESQSKMHTLNCDSIYSEFDKEEWCSELIDSYNDSVAAGYDTELILSIYTTSNDVTKARSSQVATMNYVKETGDDYIKPQIPVEYSGPLAFEIYDGEARVVSCDESASGTIEIPKYFKNYPVTRINYYAFSRCKDITSVIIPDTVEYIGRNAFAWCTGLKSIVIPDSVTSMGVGCFWHCENLVVLKLPNHIKKIPAWTCEGCYSLAEITIPDTVTAIGESAFKYCKTLTKLTIPSSVTFLENGCFCHCESLKEVKISQGTTIIDKAIFAQCFDLTDITIPRTVECIGRYAFDDTALQDVYYTGTEEEWKLLTKYIYLPNAPLVDATMHYKMEKLGQKVLVVPTVAKTETDEIYTFTVTTPEKLENAVLYIALYDENGKLIGIKAADFDSTTKTVEIDKDKNTVSSKIFLWDNKQDPAATAPTIDL